MNDVFVQGKNEYFDGLVQDCSNSNALPSKLRKQIQIPPNL